MLGLLWRDLPGKLLGHGLHGLRRRLFLQLHGLVGLRSLRTGLLLSLWEHFLQSVLGRELQQQRCVECVLCLRPWELHQCERRNVLFWLQPWLVQLVCGRNSVRDL